MQLACGKKLDAADGILSGVIRSKGFLWIASRHDYAYVWSQAGVSVQINPAGLWWAAAPEDMWPEDIPENYQLLSDIKQEFEEPYGDRRQEIVFIGIDFDQPVIELLLEECLLTDEEMSEGPSSWVSYDDPLPQIELVEEDDPITEEI